MSRCIAVGLVVLAVSTSAALAAERNDKASAVQQFAQSERDQNGNMRVNPGTPGESGSNAALHSKTHRESGYKAKSDFNANGTVRVNPETTGMSGSNAALHAKTHRESGSKSKSDYNANGTVKVH